MYGFNICMIQGGNMRHFQMPRKVRMFDDLELFQKIYELFPGQPLQTVECHEFCVYLQNQMNIWNASAAY